MFEGVRGSGYQNLVEAVVFFLSFFLHFFYVLGSLGSDEVRIERNRMAVFSLLRHL